MEQGKVGLEAVKTVEVPGKNRHGSWQGTERHDDVEKRYGFDNSDHVQRKMSLRETCVRLS